jgi:hypothetical protein
LGLGGARLEQAYHPAAAIGRVDGMRTENAEGIGVARDEEGVETGAKWIRGRCF